jgi:uncharacterized protein YegL
MSEIIQDSELVFHTDLDEDGYHFGILKLSMKKVPITNKTVFLYFSVDNSGSMDEFHRGKSKLSFVKTTLKNMILFLEKQDADIYVQINTFSNSVEKLVDCMKITTTNSEEIIDLIDNLRADSDTDIGKALVVANELIGSYKREYPDHEVAHIFMSDGSPTVGLTTVEQLYPLVQTEFNNTFIGFGLDHNAHLFHKFSEKSNTEYRFIDKFENTALVYGEIIHQLLYPALTNIQFDVQGGEIYDWKTNSWSNQVTESVIVSEAEKVYHVRTLYSTSETRVDIVQDRNIIESVYTLPSLVSLENGNIEPSCIEDLAKYQYRQRTMECLFESKKRLNSVGKQELKNKMQRLFRDMRKYMREKDMLEEPMLKLLCDDIYITYKTMNSAYGMMFAVARCSSQGRQQAYNTTIEQDGVDETDDDMDSDGETVVLSFGNRRHMGRPASSLTSRRSSSTLTSLDDGVAAKNIDEDDLSNYVSTNSTFTCYSTPTGLNTMREMSQI